jgi:TldD protein
MNERVYRPYSRKLSGRFQEFADSLLVHLVKDTLLAELFWEESHRTIIDFRPDGSSMVVQKWLRGAQLRAVAERSAATSWTTDLSPPGLVRLFAGLKLKKTPKRFAAWPKSKPVSPVSIEDLTKWQDATSQLVERLRQVLIKAPQLQAQFSWDRYLRGSAGKPGEGREQGGERILLKIVVTREDGSSLRRVRLFDAPLAPETLINSGLLKDLKAAWKKESKKRGGFAGSMPVVVAPGQGAILFHELVGHSLEADHVLTGSSPFSACAYGQNVTHPELTIIDSPDPTHGCGGLAWDDEGQIAKTVTLIDSGAVAGLLHDRVTSTMVGISPTGNGRREHFRSEPGPRMRNIVVSPGPHSADALLSGIRRGLYIERLSHGRADLAAGRFSLAVESGRRIKRGKLSEPLRDVLIRGEILQTLSEIPGVGNDWQVSPEPLFCSKNGVVITGVAGPTVRLGRLEVVS